MIRFHIPWNLSDDFFKKIMTDKIPIDSKNYLITRLKHRVKGLIYAGNYVFGNYNYYYKIIANYDNTFNFVYIIYNSTSDMKSSFNKDHLSR